MAFEVFRGRNRKFVNEASVTLGVSGSIGLNAYVVRHIGESRFAMLMFDRERDLIGIKFINKHDPDAYPVKVSGRSNHGSISGTAFLKSFGLFPSKTKNYPANYDDKDKMLTVDVSGGFSEKKKVKGQS